MTCQNCARDPHPPGFGEPRRCAFESGTFDANNWSCATMGRLRWIAEDMNLVHWEDDQKLAVLCVPETDDEAAGWLVMTWYKSRGATGSALVIGSSNQWAPLTLETAIRVLTAYDGEVMG